MAHTVSISWTASDTPGVTGYNVYRGTASGQETTLLTATPVTASPFVDTAPLSGEAYYMVESLIGTVSSGPSNETTAVVLPDPPTNVVAVVN